MGERGTCPLKITFDSIPMWTTEGIWEKEVYILSNLPSIVDQCEPLKAYGRRRYISSQTYPQQQTNVNHWRRMGERGTSLLKLTLNSRPMWTTEGVWEKEVHLFSNLPSTADHCEPLKAYGRRRYISSQIYPQQQTNVNHWRHMGERGTCPLKLTLDCIPMWTTEGIWEKQVNVLSNLPSTIDKCEPLKAYGRKRYMSSQTYPR